MANHKSVNLRFYLLIILNLYEDSYVPILLTGIDIRDTDLDKIIKKSSLRNIQ